jgi:UDP-N-acetylmuramoyl-L-alanyl-D-glutamate--2,6-diaminopimelate ligase
LEDLLEEVEVEAVRGPLDVEVRDLAYDSRRVRPGAAFFALAGAKQDGRAFARAAVDAGAVAVFGRGLESASVTVIEVAEPRKALAQAAGRWNEHPARGLEVIGITGTNGKTTTTYLLESIFRAAGRTTGVIGTTGYRIGDEARPAPFTTPEAPELQGLLAEMREHGVRSVAMEVSSHALVQRRAFGVEFDVAVFTNLTQDHLDYHGTMESYLDAKLMLFDGRNGVAGHWVAVVNRDDPAAPAVIDAARRGHGAIVSFGETASADVRIADLAPAPEGLFFHIHVGEGTHGVRLPLLGRYNAWNAAAAFAAARALHVPAPDIVRGLESVAGVPGRLQRVRAGQPFEVVVDYAHTPDALTRALAAVREHGRGRLLLVFGCGGDRDRGKRPAMGRVAAEGSDVAWVTNDNPRGEDPAAIAAEIVAGAPGQRLRVVLDRRAAIGEALAAARPGDTVLIAGKGHETTQTIGDQVLPFDDRGVARELLSQRENA